MHSSETIKVVRRAIRCGWSGALVALLVLAVVISRWPLTRATEVGVFARWFF